MNVRQALDYADGVKANDYSDDQKLQWLNELEGKIQVLIYGTKPGVVKAYALPADEETELLAPQPFDKAYWMWLCAMIDFANGEYDKYQSTAAMANDAYSEYARWYMRNKFKL